MKLFKIMRDISIGNDAKVCVFFLSLTLGFGYLTLYDREHNAHIAFKELMSMELPISSKIILSGRQQFLGNPDAPYTLVEFGDYECPPCRAYQQQIVQTMETYHNQIRLDFRNYPLTKIHPHAMEAALIAEAARSKSKFWTMHETLFKTDLKKTLDARIRTDLGLLNALQTKSMKHAIQEDQDMADRLGVEGTPTFILCTPEGRSFKLDKLERIHNFLP